MRSLGSSLINFYHKTGDFTNKPQLDRINKAPTRFEFVQVLCFDVERNYDEYVLFSIRGWSVARQNIPLELKKDLRRYIL
jgi:hypothetical protein